MFQVAGRVAVSRQTLHSWLARRGDLRRQDTCVDIVESPSLMSVVVLYPTSPQARMPGWGARRSGPGTARWQRDRR